MDESEAGLRRLGVLGTLVWDTIRGPESSDAVEEWGGIAYALSAFEAAGPTGWELLPMIKVGRDLSDEARRLLRSYRRIASLEGVRIVSQPNNRVELQYSDEDSGRRRERLRGGVPGWEWPELAPLVETCDAVYVNFIAGWELDLPGARRLRREFDGPIYADLHSLLLEVGPDGTRRPRPVDGGRRWIGCFDFVQMNEEELETLAAGCGEDPWEFAASVVGRETRALFVTLGPRGATWVTAGDFRRSGGGSDDPGSEGSVRAGRRPPRRKVSEADPTGCGDVWGITCFGALLQGLSPEEAAGRANEVAARNAGTRGATGLLE